MAIPLRVEKIVRFAEISTDWVLIQVSIDWNGKPLLLFEEGRLPFPLTSGEELNRWYQTIPTAHHLVSLHGGEWKAVEVPNNVGVKITSFAQPLGDGWLLIEARSGIGRLCSQDGIHLTTIDLGDAIQDVQTTADGYIWVSYFDEGVFGNGIGTNGLVCFDAEGKDIFRFSEFAETANLPHIDDCYAMNVSGNKTWLSYYSDFPLVCLSDFKLQALKEKIGSFSAFAVRGDKLLAHPFYQTRSLIEIDLTDRREQQFEPVDDQSIPLSPFRAAARGAELFLYTEEALYRVL
jgi:hypothetical protein